MTPVQAAAVIFAGIAFAGLFLWLIGETRALREDIDAARDEADQARAGVLAVHDHLAGSEPAGTGRHAAVAPSRRAIATSGSRTGELPPAGVSSPATLRQAVPSQTKRGTR